MREPGPEGLRAKLLGPRVALHVDRGAARARLYEVLWLDSHTWLEGLPPLGAVPLHAGELRAHEGLVEDGRVHGLRGRPW